jgi:ubiquinone biosynthesis protein
VLRSGAVSPDIADIVADYSALPLKDWSLADAFLRVTRLGQKQNVFFPYDLVVLTRALCQTDTVVRILDPDFLLLDHLLAKGPKF